MLVVRGGDALRLRRDRHELHEVLESTDSRDRTIFSRLRRNEIMEAYTYGFNIDEMPWDSDSTDAREKLPYVTLSIENDRFVADAPGERRELSLGTDLFDDITYDTVDYDLHNNGMILRGRARWDSLTEVRRNPTHELPATSLFHTKLVNEVQIELTSVEPYIARIDELEAQIAGSGSTHELERQLAGAKFILDESIRTLQVVAELEGPAIVERLEDEGLTAIAWEPAKYSKGQTALRILTDTDDNGQ